MRVNISVIVFHSSNKILIQDRRNISKRGEEYGFFGGHVEAGESSSQAIVREVKEELHFDLLDYSFFKDFFEEFDGKTYVLHVFLAKCPDLSLFKLSEGRAMLLVSESEALKIMRPIDKEIVKAVFEQLRTN